MVPRKNGLEINLAGISSSALVPDQQVKKPTHPVTTKM